MIKKADFRTVIIVLTFFSISSLSMGQMGFEKGDKNNLKYESGSFLSDFFASYQADTVTGTKDEKIIKANSDPANKYDQIESKDSTKYSVFGDLLEDNPAYNKKYPIWIPMLEVPILNVTIMAYNRYVSNADFARINPETWAHNLKTSMEWDIDRFGMNFLGHPYSGGLNFTSARANGYNFWESLPFAIGGSLLWEYFGEKTLPAYNDIINTPISGAFYGEVFYRLSSNVLDDRTSGSERFLREFGAALISPTRFINRLIQGKLTRHTSVEVYQKAPLNIELSLGMRRVNDGRTLGSGSQNLMISTQFDYGYALEKRDWKPYDYFKIRLGANFGVGRKILELVSGYGVLFGKTVMTGKLEMMTGIFQHYNYFDNVEFELGTIAFSGGVMSKYSLAKHLYIFTNFHLGVIPLAGNSTRFGPTTSEERDYNYGGGIETKLESGLDFGWGNLQLIAYYFWINTYVGASGNNYIGILKPRITIRLYKNLNVGFEHMVYYSNRYTADHGDFHQVRTEQRLYLMINLGNFKL